MNGWLWAGLPIAAVGLLATRAWAGSEYSAPFLGPLLLIAGWSLTVVGIGHTTWA